VNINKGKLTVNLGTPKADYLSPIGDNITGGYDDSDNTLKISNRNAKGYILSMFCNEDGVRLSYRLGDSIMDNIMLCYVNSNVTITGSVTDVYNGRTYRDTYALNLRTGWNYMIMTYDYNYDDDEESMSIDIVIQTVQPGKDAKWVVYGGGGGDEPTPKPTVTPLTNGQWFNGTFTREYDEHQYSFTVTAGTTYYVWWNDRYDGNDTKTADIEVYAYDSNDDFLFYGDNGWDNPQEFTAEYSGTVYLSVMGYDGDTGTYAIAYSTNSTRPQ
jgi:hypothetical protein